MTRTIETLNNLADALVENGFEKQAALDLVTPPQPKDFGPLFGYAVTGGESIAFKISESPALENIPQDLLTKVKYDARTQTLELASNLTDDEIEAIKPAFISVELLETFEHGVQEAKARKVETTLTPSERAETFAVPVLAYRQGNLLEQLEETHFLNFVCELPKQNAMLTESARSTPR